MKFKLSKKEILLTVAWFLIVCIGLFAIKSVFVVVSQDDYNDATSELYETDLYDKSVLQTVEISQPVEKISFIMTNNSSSTQPVIISIWDETKTTLINQMETALVANNGIEQIVEWIFAEKTEFPENVIIEVSSPVAEEEKVYACVQETTFDDVYTENGEEIESHLRMAVVYDREYNWPAVAICGLLLLFTGMIFILDFIKKVPTENLFLVIAVLTGLLFAMMSPFGQEPDGWVHFLRSMDVSQGNVLLPLADNNGDSSMMNVPANINDIDFRKIEPDMADAVAYMNNINQMHFSNKIVEMLGLGGFTSFFYFPQAIGLFVARILGLSVYGYMVCGRVVNLCAYLTLAYIGLKKMPVLRNIYMVIALLPMTLFQAASFSYDATLNGLCFLFIALCFNYAYKKESLSWKDMLSLGGILAMLLLCKYVYVCIGLLVFIIPMKKFGSTKEYWKTFAIALVPFVLMLGYLFLSAGIPDASTNALETSDATQISQLQYILMNPVFGVKVLVRTIITYTNYYVEQLNTLGWLNYELGLMECLMPVIMGVVAVLDTKGYTDKVTLKNRLLYFATFCVVVLAGLVGLYLMDYNANPVAAPTVLGYQGRYTIPVLMLLLATCASGNVENKIKNFSYKVAGVMALSLSYSTLMLLNKCY